MKKKLGSQERLWLPQVADRLLHARIDTGAATSSLHCCSIEPYQDGEELRVRFVALDPRHPAYTGQQLDLPTKPPRRVRSSSGHSEMRYFVELQIRIGPDLFEALFSLTDRSQMNYPILIGRQLLNGRYIVDVAKKNLATRKKKKKD